MRKLLYLFKGYRKECALGPLFKLFEALLDLIVPLIMAYIIDVCIAGGRSADVVKMCLLLVLIGIVGLASAITAQYFAAKASVGFASKLRARLFSHLQNLSFTELDTTGTSTMITRLTSDINQVQTAVNIALRLLLRSPFVVVGAIILAFTIDTTAALVFLGVTVLLTIVTFGIMLTGIPLYKKVQARLDKVLLRTRENLTGVRVIRAFNKESEEIEQFEEDNRLLIKTQTFASKISALLNPLTFCLVNIGIVALLYIGAIKIETGLLTQGAIIALIDYMNQILVELVKFANMIISMTKGIACTGRVQQVLEITPSMEEGTVAGPFDPSQKAITFENVTLTYAKSNEPSLENISFSANKGDIIGVIGGTGSGKSSLVNLIPRFYDATKGAVKIFGVDVKDLSFETLRNTACIVMQKSVLFKGTIRENLLWGNKFATDEELWEALKIAQAEDVVKSKTKGLDEIIEQGGRNLSGGQRQRLCIARTLVKKPEILILDDSSSALDFATDAALRKAISTLRYNPTVVVVSQRASSVQNADKILVLDDGMLVGAGVHDELLDSCEVYREIYQSQYKSGEEM